MPIFDFQALSNRLCANEKNMRFIFEKFTEDYCNQIVELKESLENNDVDQVYKTVHTMKGSSANVGAMVLSSLALAFELAGNNDELTSLHQKVVDIENAFSVFKQTVKERLY